MADYLSGAANQEPLLLLDGGNFEGLDCRFEGAVFVPPDDATNFYHKFRPSECYNSLNERRLVTPASDYAPGQNRRQTPQLHYGLRR